MRQSPSFDDIRQHVYIALTDAQDWLLTDWKIENGPTAEQTKQCAQVLRLVGMAKLALGRAAR